jgi:hypothetical protein
MKTISKILVGAFLSVVAIATLVGGNDKSGATTHPAATAPAVSQQPKALERLQTLMPSDEAATVAAVEAAREQYASAANDMAKGASRPTRAKAICAALNGLSIDGWVGRVAKLDSNGEGKGVLSVQIGHDVFAKTWNNAISDIGANTLIEPSSPLFAAASRLRVGQLVRFGGSLFQDEADCIREASLTFSGSIREPEFIFKFTSISPIQ